MIWLFGLVMLTASAVGILSLVAAAILDHFRDDGENQ